MSMPRHDATPRLCQAPREPLVLLTVFALTAAILVALSMIVLPAIGDAASGPVYTIGDLNQRIAGNARAWMGRTVRVEGMAVSYRTRSGPFTWQQHFILVDARTPYSTDRLPLAIGSSNPILTLVRRIPVIGGLAGGAPELQTGVPAVYRVQLQALPTAFCAACYEVVLRDSL
jgi:hypothetical protein